VNELFVTLYNVTNIARQCQGELVHNNINR